MEIQLGQIQRPKPKLPKRQENSLIIFEASLNPKVQIARKSRTPTMRNPKGADDHQRDSRLTIR